jgi:hypothetical protein
MNLKTSVLKIAVVIALICMLVPVIAAEDVDNSALADDVDDGDVISEDADTTDDGDDEDLDDTDEEIDDEDEEGYGEDGDDAELDGDDSADLQVVVLNSPQKADVGDLVEFGILVANKGPDTSHNVIVRCQLVLGSMKLTDIKLTQGTFDMKTGLWYVGDLAPGQVAGLYLQGIVLTPEDLLLKATVTSDTYDPDLSNNVGYAFIDVAGDEEVPEQSRETLPETGNPVALAMLALLSIAGVGLRKKF